MVPQSVGLALPHEMFSEQDIVVDWPVIAQEESTDGSPETSFSSLRDPEPSYSIQVDTPQPHLMSSPREVVNPSAVFVAQPEPVKVFQFIPFRSWLRQPVYFGDHETHTPSSAGGHIVQSRPVSASFYEQPMLIPASANQLQSPAYLNNGENLHLDYLPGVYGRAISSGPRVSHGGSHDPCRYGSAAPLAPLHYSNLASPRTRAHPSPVKNQPSATCEVLTPIKRGPGRPRKDASLKYQTPRKIAGSMSKPVRTIHTPKTPRDAVESPTPTRKSRGCWTCKCRRKKCDEKRPGCAMCKKLSLPCLGYREERPECMLDSSKTEQTRATFASMTKQRRESVKQCKVIVDDSN